METLSRKRLPKKIQSRIKFAENFLFSIPEGGSVDYSKLNVESSFYDVAYEKEIRRTDFNLIYFLEELKFYLGGKEGVCLDVLDHIESRLFFSQFYRPEISGENFISIAKDVMHLANLLDQEILYVEHYIPSEDYKKTAEKISISQTPRTKEDFIRDLRELSLSFKNKALDCEGF